MALCIWLFNLTVPLFDRFVVFPWIHVIWKPWNWITILSCHLLHRSTVPFPLTCCNRVAVTHGAPSSPRRITVPPCRRRTETRQRHIAVHLRTWHTSLHTWQLSLISLFILTVWRNFTIWSIAKNNHDYFNEFSKRTMGLFYKHFTIVRN